MHRKWTSAKGRSDRHLHLSKTSTALLLLSVNLWRWSTWRVVSGSDRRGYVYRICYWDDNEAMRKRIKHFLSDQIVQGCARSTMVDK